jgi:hypothetical protein
MREQGGGGAYVPTCLRTVLWDLAPAKLRSRLLVLLPGEPFEPLYASLSLLVSLLGDFAVVGGLLAAMAQS